MSNFQVPFCNAVALSCPRTQASKEHPPHPLVVHRLALLLFDPQRTKPSIKLQESTKYVFINSKRDEFQAVFLEIHDKVLIKSCVNTSYLGFPFSLSFCTLYGGSEMRGLTIPNRIHGDYRIYVEIYSYFVVKLHIIFMN